MARSADVIEDPTPLDGLRVDVPARIGWLLRMARLSAGVTLRAMPQRLAEHGVRSSTASLSRLETAGQRHGRLVDAYEQALALPAGTLRATVDQLCRLYLDAPADLDPGPGEPDLARFSARVEAVQAREVSGGDWLAFSAEHVHVRGFGLPASAMAPLLRRLCEELTRSVGVAFLTRYEALARLHSSAYAGLVGEVVEELDDLPGLQALVDSIRAVTLEPGTELLEHSVAQLGAETTREVSGAVLAIENVRMRGGLDAATWLAVARPFVAAYEPLVGRTGAADVERRLLLERLFRLLPAPTRRAVEAALSAPVPPAPGPADWSRTRRNTHYGFAQRLAERACAEVGVPEQPLLARLVFELLFDLRVRRSSAASGILLATPFADALTRLLVEAATEGPDDTTRHGARDTVSGVAGAARSLPDVSGWLASDDASLVRAAHLLHGQTGVPVPERALLDALEGERALGLTALYGAGMSRHPLLPALAGDPDRPAWVRDLAGSWAARGGRISR